MCTEQETSNIFGYLILAEQQVCILFFYFFDVYFSHLEIGGVLAPLILKGHVINSLG